MQWDVPTLAREQMILFPTSLDDAVPHDAFVRDFDAILRVLDWTCMSSQWRRTGSSRRVRIWRRWRLAGRIS